MSSKNQSNDVYKLIARESGVLTRQNKSGTAGEQTRHAIMTAFEELGGYQWLVELGKENPRQFASLLAKLTPSEVNQTVEVKHDIAERLIEGRRRVFEGVVIPNHSSDSKSITRDSMRTESGIHGVNSGGSETVDDNSSALPALELSPNGNFHLLDGQPVYSAVHSQDGEIDPPTPKIAAPMNDDAPPGKKPISLNSLPEIKKPVIDETLTGNNGDWI